MVARRRKIKTNLSAIFQFISSPNQLNTFLFLVFGSQWFNLFSPSHKTHTLTHKTLPSLSSSSSSLFSLSLSSPSSFFVANLSSFPLFSHFFPRRLRDRHETFRLTSFSHTLLLIHTHTHTHLFNRVHTFATTKFSHSPNFSFLHFRTLRAQQLLSHRKVNT